MPKVRLEETELAEGASRIWWLFLITGIIWLWISLIILRLNLESVTAIAILFGFVAIGFGLNEFFAIPASTTGWKIAHGILGVVFVAAGIVAFFEPAGTFVALASLVAWVLLFKGIFDITVAIVTHETVRLWWIGLVIGVARDPGRLLGGRLLPRECASPRRLGSSAHAHARHHGDRDGVPAPLPQEDHQGRDGLDGLAAGFGRATRPERAAEAGGARCRPARPPPRTTRR